MTWENRHKKRRRKCRHHKYKIVGRRRRGHNEYYLFVCVVGDHHALFEIKRWWGFAGKTTP